MRIRVPATTANLGCGYDTFGMAIGYYNYIECEEAEALSINIIGQGARRLPRDGRNLVLRSAQALSDEAGYGPVKLAFTVHNNIPLSRGMGSSSSAIVGGLYSANHMLGSPLDHQAILDLAVRIEGHPDNVTPALLGGFTINAREGGLYTRRILVPAGLKTVLAVPSFTVSTKKARAIMPQKVSLADAIFNLSHAACLTAALAAGDLSGFGLMLRDRLHQPYRAALIPGAEQVMEAANAAGALGCAISGSGPTMIAFYQGDNLCGRNIGLAMKRAFSAHHVEAWIMRLPPDNSGTRTQDPGKQPGVAANGTPHK